MLFRSRGRYWTEFAAPLYGKQVAALSRRIKAVADTLGALHDLDVALEHVESDALAPALLPRRLRRARADALDEAANAWRRLRKPRLIARAMADLK